MMDEADISEERERIARESAVAALLRAKPCRPDPNGECHACGEPAAGYKLFCDSECAERWEIERKRK